MKQRLYIALDNLLQRRNTLGKFGAIATPEQRAMYDHVDDEINRLCREHLPSGSGFDNGSDLVKEACFKPGQPSPFPSMLVFKTAFHHMDDNGSYIGWTEHMLYVRPGFSSTDITVSGKNKRDIKSYIHDVFHAVLNMEVEYEPVPWKVEKEEPVAMGLVEDPYPHGHPLHKAVFQALSSYRGDATFEDGVRGLIEELEEDREGRESALAAIKYALEHTLESPMEFLRCWNEGDFEAIRREWPNVPDVVFIGADPLFKKEG